MAPCDFEISERKVLRERRPLSSRGMSARRTEIREGGMIVGSCCRR
jgi:hypothetical protein